jgi:hypothetical protein
MPISVACWRIILPFNQKLGVSAYLSGVRDGKAYSQIVKLC